MAQLYARRVPCRRDAPRPDARLHAVALALAGCSGGGEPSATSNTGAAVFADAGCGGCHALSAADSTGTAGPSLDALKPNAERVERQVVSGGRGMPAFGGQLTDEEIDAVSAYVAESAAKSKVSVAAAFEPDGTKLADCKADSACFEQAFGNLAYNEGPKRALAVFDEQDRDRADRRA